MRWHGAGIPVQQPGVGTCWSYFQAAASHSAGSVTQTSNANTVLQALSEGCLVSLLSAGSGGRFISAITHVLRKVLRQRQVLVNDPMNGKNYSNREFDMMEIMLRQMPTGSSRQK